MKILIAEDYESSRKLLRVRLEELGHQVVEAADGAEAWRALEAAHFPVLIVDWVMPGVDGLELTRRLRALARANYTYVIMLTSVDGREQALGAMRVGVDDFLTKPLDAPLLEARLTVAERVLGLQHRVRMLEGILPMCSYCRKIREEDGGWSTLENYVASKTDALFSHGVCPDCLEAHARPQLEKLRRMRKAWEST